jgi:predicted metalloendopeptidase
MRKIDDITDWKLDWALKHNPNAMNEIEHDAGHIGIHLQVEQLPADMRANVNPAVDPCEDFYEFACGHWDEEKGVKIPSDSTSKSLQWDEVDHDIQKKMKALLETDESPAAVLYRSCMAPIKPQDADTVLGPWLDIVDTVVDNSTFVEAVIAINNADLSFLWTWYVDTDAWNKQRHAFTISQSHTSLDADLVAAINEDPTDTDAVADLDAQVMGLKTLASTLFQLVGIDGADDMADQVVDMEVQILSGQNDTDDDSGGGDYSQWIDRDWLASECPSINWTRWFDGINFTAVGLDTGNATVPVDDAGQPMDSPRLVAKQGDYLKTIDDIVTCRGVDTETCYSSIRAYMLFKLILNYAPYLDESFVDAIHTWHNVKYGARAKQQRWKVCYNSATALLGWSSSFLFVERTFPPARRASTMDMLDSIRREFRASLAHTRWMDPSSRRAAQDKLDKMFFEVGYPLDWPESVHRNDGQLSESGYAANVDVIGRNAVERARRRVFEPVPRNSWGESYPIVVNAYYSPTVNGLWVPAGIIQRPFYDDSFGPARNYGALGTICGHEMTHGFDDTGHKMDGNGDEKDWWDPETFAEFDRRADCLKAQYSGYGKEYALYDGGQVNGNATLGENIADEGGMRFAYSAFSRLMPLSRNTAAEHRTFFTAFAQNWCEVDTKRTAKDSLKSDEHSPAKYRVLGVLSNFAPFSKAFNCRRGSRMNPVSKCELW